MFTIRTSLIYKYLQVKSTKILHYSKFVNIVNFMNKMTDPNTQAIIDRSTDKGLFVNDDDQDWGSAGMNNVHEASE
tara:strand:- start:384 stop:611 length:228 start_codon:yes stop_codon:yes gene_type:complete